MDAKTFYPVTREIARGMIADLRDHKPHYVLEPEAGRGALADAIREHFTPDTAWNRDKRCSVKIDVIEVDPDYRAILSSKGYPLVGVDFLTYNGVAYYDTVFMNPPFDKGAEHLLKAWDFIHEGLIICLLNAETLSNPCTPERRRLVDLIRLYGEVTELGQPFRASARPTDVEVVRVRLKKVDPDDILNLWTETGSAEKSHAADTGQEALPVRRSELENYERAYDVVGEHMRKAFAHIRYACEIGRASGLLAMTGSDFEKILTLATNNKAAAWGEFSTEFRYSSWLHVLNKTRFNEWLDKEQKDKMLTDLKQGSHVPFTAENIQATLETVMLSRASLFRQSAYNVFVALTNAAVENSVWGEAWKSNSDIRVNKRIVVPNMMRYCKIMKSFSVYWGQRTTDLTQDLDRVLCVISKKPFAESLTIGKALQDQVTHVRVGSYKSGAAAPTHAESDFFRIRVFQKGTMHLHWKDLNLMQEFNKIASQGKRELSAGR